MDDGRRLGFLVARRTAVVLILGGSLSLSACRVGELSDAREAYRSGDRAGAEKLYLSLLEDAPSSPLIRIELAHLYAEAGALDRAFRMLSRIGPVREPSWIDALAATLGRLGGAYLEQGKNETAARCFARAIALWPGSADLFDALGRAEFRRGHHRQAIGPFLTSIALAPENDGAYFYLGLIDQISPTLDDTLASHHEALEERPTDAALSYRVGVLHEVRWRWRHEPADRRAALDAFEHVSAERPDFANPWFHRYALLGAVDDPAAPTFFERYRALRKLQGLRAPSANLADILLLPMRVGNSEGGLEQIPPTDQS